MWRFRNEICLVLLVEKMFEAIDVAKDLSAPAIAGGSSKLSWQISLAMSQTPASPSCHSLATFRKGNILCLAQRKADYRLPFDFL